MRASGLRGQIMVTVWLHSHFWTSLATKQRPQKAWRVNSRRPRKSWDPTFQLPENCYALFFWNTLEDNGKENVPFEQGWFNQSRHRRVSNTGRRTDDHHNILRWYNELLKVENRSSSESVMIITGQRERQTSTEFLSVLSGVFSVLQNSRTWHSVSPDWRVGFLMLLRLRGAPFRGFLLQEITRTKRTMGYSAPNELERFKHTHP